MTTDAMNQVLSAIFTSCWCSVDIAVPDQRWLDQLSPELRQAAVEIHVGQLAKFGYIRRIAGYAALTISGLEHHYSQVGTRKAA